MKAVRIEGSLDKDLIQLSSPLAPEFQGGLLIDESAHPVGIILPSERSKSAPPLGVAIPIQTAVRVCIIYDFPPPKAHVWLGVTAENLDPNDARGPMLPVPGAVVVAAIIARSPAAVAQLKVGDLIVKANGKPIRERGALMNLLYSMKSGDTLSLVVWRNGKERIVRVIPELEGARNR